MEEYSRIKLSKHPRVWIKDKYETGWHSKETYFPAITIWIAAAISLFGSLYNIFKITDVLTILLVIFLFIFGLLNVWYATTLQKNAVRIKRIEEACVILHHDIIHILRDYRTRKERLTRENKPLDRESIIRYIQKVLENVVIKFMNVVHYSEVSACVKYLKANSGKKLYSIRYGPDLGKRDSEPEELDDSNVFLRLCDPKKHSFIYIKNVDKYDENELKVIGDISDKITSRANKYLYKTFLAFPIRTGNINLEDAPPPAKYDLGMLCFDLKKAYAFGNVHKYEIHFLLCIADLLSEIINDLIKQSD